MELPDTQKCTGPCGKDLPLELFGKMKGGKFGRRARCPKCRYRSEKDPKRYEKLRAKNPGGYQRVLAKNRQYQKNNQDKVSPARQRRNWLKRYGLTLDQYDEMLARQNGRCAICLRFPEATNKMHVDHCHVTGKIRGILCRSCNWALGQFREDRYSLSRAIEYLSRG